jgi:hypothetical protein
MLAIPGIIRGCRFRVLAQPPYPQEEEEEEEG